MTGSIRRHILKYASVLILVSLFVLAACTKINTEPQPPAAPAESKKPVVLRTNEVFDQNKYKGLLTVRYFYLQGDVATGDCILIQTPDGKTMMVDAGLASAGPQIVGYLNKLGVSTIDIALNTHPHTDHIGGFATVMQQKEVKKFYTENLPYEQSSSYRKTMEVVKAKNIPHENIEEGDAFQLGNDVKIEVLSPQKGVLPQAVKSFEAAELNYYSLVLRVTYKDNVFLLTGDIYTDRESELIEAKGKQLDADMLHAPHHGNATSSSVSFVKAVSPKITVLSSNIFNSLQVYNRYKQANSQVYSTGLNGNILITSDGKNLSVITEKDSELDKQLSSGRTNTAKSTDS